VGQQECGLIAEPLWWGGNMPISDPALWTVIRDHPLPFRQVQDNQSDPPRVCTSFADCLRMKGDWTDGAAARITAIYRQFLYLKALSGEPVTPSTCMDAAWHLHLEFKEDYAALCRAVGRDIPHLVDLSHVEQQRAHEVGRALYEAEFDTAPARDLWPSHEEQNNADKLVLVCLGGGIVILFSISLGGATGSWLLALPAMAGFAAINHFYNKWSGASPEQMSRGD
jgi:hypothetical protein